MTNWVCGPLVAGIHVFRKHLMHTPLVPSWLEEDSMTTHEGAQTEPIPPDVNRFTGPRGSFTKYVSGGGRDGSSMRNAISQYVSRSLGGSARATTRLGSARNSTAKLYGILNTLSGNGGVREIARQFSINNLEGLSASDFFV